MLLLLSDALGSLDGSGGADQPAKVATDTFGADDAGLASRVVEADSLVTAIHAGGVAASATDATLTIDLRIDDGLAVEVGRQDEIGQLLTYERLQLLDAT